MPAGRDVAASSGRFGPDAYRQWRANRLGAITETIERRLILRLAGEVQDESVLDVGCGDGALVFACRERGASTCIGVDVDRRMIVSAAAEAARRNAAVRFLLADAERLPFCNDSFDLVTMITVLAFMTRPQAALREIARVLKPGGRLVLGDLGKWSLWAASRRVRGWLGSAPLWRGARFRSASELRALAEAAGLHTGQVAGAIYYPRCAAIASLMAPLDPRLGELTAFGAGFIALQASKAD